MQPEKETLLQIFSSFRHNFWKLNYWTYGEDKLVVIFSNVVFFYLLIDCPREEELEDFREEIEMMKTIGYHKNIVNLVGCNTKREPLCLVVEYMCYGDLLNYLRQRRSKVSINTMSLNLFVCALFLKSVLY